MIVDRHPLVHHGVRPLRRRLHRRRGTATGRSPAAATPSRSRRSGRRVATSSRRSAAGAATSSAPTARRRRRSPARTAGDQRVQPQGDRHGRREHRRVRERGRAGPDPRRAEDPQAEQPGPQDDRHVRHRHDRPDLVGHPADQPGRGAPGQRRRLDDHAVRLRRRRRHVRRDGQRLGGAEERAQGGVRLVGRGRLPAHGHLRHERPLRPERDDHAATVDADPRLGRGARPGPAGVLVGQPRPRLPGRRR